MSYELLGTVTIPIDTPGARDGTVTIPICLQSTPLVLGMVMVVVVMVVVMPIDNGI
jgi:hypothetical protein